MSSLPTSTNRASATPHNGGLAIGLVYLDHWPDLPAALDEREVLVNRICNLLSKKPRASHLIHLLLQAPKDEVHGALRGLLSSGCIRIGQASTVPGTGSPPVPTVDREALPHARPGTLQPAAARTGKGDGAGTLGKLWSRLSSS